MADIKIYAEDYANLTETFSEKNIINTVSGQEYLVTSAGQATLLLQEVGQEKPIEEIILDPDTRSIMFIGSSYTSAGSYQSFGGKDWQSARAEASSLIGIKSYEYARAEEQIFEGSKEFVVVGDIASQVTRNTKLVCDFEIRYTQSEGDVIDRDAYKFPGKTAFFSENIFPFKYENGIKVTGKDGYFRNAADEIVHSTSNYFIQCEGSTAVATVMILPQEQYTHTDYVGVPPPQGGMQYCKAEIIQVAGEPIKDSGENTVTATETKIRVSYRFAIWAAFNHNDAVSKKSTVLCVDEIAIKVKIDSLSFSVVDFVYTADNVTKERKYELETNELFQFYAANAAGSATNLSRKIAEAVIDSYSTDRRIITFDLLKMEKYQFDDANKYFNVANDTSPFLSNEPRYIDVDDEFDLYGEHGEFNGTFKVLKANGIWDGAYHKNITAILVSDNK